MAGKFRLYLIRDALCFCSYGFLKTSKAEAGLHGWGLKSAQTAAEKYDGMVQTSYTGNIFRAIVTLSYQGVSVE